jgi:tetratricopeptide (TPR) repeat protein
VPIKIDVATPAVVIDSLKKQLRGAPQFNAQAWAQAANFALRQANDAEQAAAWADKSLQITPNFQGRMVKAAILEKKGASSDAEAMRAQALDGATEVELNQYGYQLLLNENKTKEAIAIFQRNAKKHPESWNVYDSLAEAYQKAGDKRAAQDNYARARELVKDAQQKTRIEKTLAELSR